MTAIASVTSTSTETETETSLADATEMMALKKQDVSSLPRYKSEQPLLPSADYCSIHGSTGNATYQKTQLPNTKPFMRNTPA